MPTINRARGDRVTLRHTGCIKSISSRVLKGQIVVNKIICGANFQIEYAFLNAFLDIHCKKLYLKNLIQILIEF